MTKLDCPFHFSVPFLIVLSPQFFLNHKHPFSIYVPLTPASIHVPGHPLLFAHPFLPIIQ
jgi:hypothetical protein